ncbi:MAG: zinc ribbon domain-containing protein [Spirochaetaceae bacterium]|jgi:Zn finger protein HypA/HybF involved in hydrogenase expression|nr:zinc ribbon domain-containing protein [Spirochaetaceae bacterium]
MKKGSPRFFCDQCGTEVGVDVKACPYCGASFASIRCPRCSFTGEESLFINGCPKCGSAASSPKKKSKKKPPEEKPETPTWLYALVVAFLVFVFTVLFFYLK